MTKSKKKLLAKSSEQKKKQFAMLGGIFGGVGLVSAITGGIVWAVAPEPDTPEDYATITFDPAGGMLDGTELRVRKGTVFGDIALPRVIQSPQYKALNGWEDLNGHEMKSDDIINGSMTIKAKWMDSGEYEVKFVNPKGDSSVTWTGITSFAVQSGIEFGKINKPVPHKPNDGDKVYRFVGWKDAATDKDIKDTETIQTNTQVYPVFDGRIDVNFINLTFSVLETEPERPDIEFKFNDQKTRSFTIEMDEKLQWKDVNCPVPTKIEATKISETETVYTEYDFIGWRVKSGDALIEITETQTFKDGDKVYALFNDAPVSLDSSYYVKDAEGNIGKIINGTESEGDIVIMHKDPISGEVIVDEGIPRETFNQRVYFGKKVTSIAPNFLRGCTSFNQYIEIPDSVTYIGSGFLYGCTSFNNGNPAPTSNEVNELVMPATITGIGKCFMYNCLEFNSPLKLNANLYTIDDYFMTGCETFSQQLSLPSLLRNIGNSFMDYCKAFNNNGNAFSIPTGLIYVGSDFMSNCTQFNQNLDFGSCNYLTAFPSGFLYSSTGYTGKIILPTSLTSIGANFCAWTDGNPDLSANFGSQPSYPLANLQRIGSSFLNKTNYAPTHDFNLGSCQNLKYLGDNFMRNDQNLTKGITLPASLEEIDDNFLYGCTSFTQDSFVMPSGIKQIGNGIFFHCANFAPTTFTLPANLESIGDEFLCGCSKFSPTSLTIPDNVTTIGNKFMYECTSFNPTTMTLSSKLEHIGDYFMYRCELFDAESFNLPNAIEYIGDAFMCGCFEFSRQLTVPNTVTHVGIAFIYGDESITSIVINCSAQYFANSDYSFTQSTAYYSWMELYETELTVYSSYFNEFLAKFGYISASYWPASYGRNLVQGS